MADAVTAAAGGAVFASAAAVLPRPGPPAADSFAIGPLRIAPNVILAPMSGITDSAYRVLVKDVNPGAVGLVVTELISIEALARHDLRTHRMLRYRARERPLAIQLFGAEPERMAEAAAIAQELGADLIDVNCGCPAPKVTKKGGGAELMRRPETLTAILRALRRALTIPYTVKIRAGWDEGSRNAVAIARLAEDEGAAMIAVHGRTRSQLYTGPADWQLVGAVKRAVGLPVVGSGDVTTASEALARLATTGIDGVMVGRGSLAHPWIFREVAALRAGLPLPPVTGAERLRTVGVLIARLARDLGPDRALGRSRGLACRMVKFVRGGAALREAIAHAPTLAAMRDILAAAADRAERAAAAEPTIGAPAAPLAAVAV